MKQIMDGNKACSSISYLFSEVAGIYPITPASTMAEYIDTFASNDEKNFFGDKVKVIEMQSEAGAIATVHGALQTGTIATTYTASQGLLLMIPNMYKIAGELLPCVINVAARTVATHALSIMGDHSDIYSARQTGFAILAQSSVQEVMDLTSVAYLSAIKGRLPFINFFDGFRTSHEFNKIDVIDKDKIYNLIDQKALESFRKRSLDIDNPTTRGTAQGDQMYFQAVEARNKYYNELPDIVNDYMKEINNITGKNYAPFTYYGSKKATKIIIAMGSVCETIKETIDYLQGNIGLITVHLYRPFSSKYLLNVMPKTVKTIAVIDRAKEPGATGEPLFLDVSQVIFQNKINAKVIGGRYGLSSKDTTPNDIEALYNYMDNKKAGEFTLGITDDVTNLSLEKTSTIFKTKAKEMLIYGYGSDGMITTSKDILTIVGNRDNKYVQGYFEYDSKKSGGVTISHLRFSDDIIRSTYYVTNPSVVVCSRDSYLRKYDVLKGIKTGSIFILNTQYDEKSLINIIPQEVIKELIDKNITFYTVNATKVAKENNIPNKISMIMEAVIFKLTNVLDFEIAKVDMKKMIEKNFLRKGQEIVDANLNAISDAINLIKIIDPKEIESNISLEKTNDSIFSKLDHLEGNQIKVSDFIGIEDGVYAAGTSKMEKRGISTLVPSFNPDKCIMCNQCSFVCPHSVIRPYLLNEEEVKNAPLEVKKDLKEAKIKDQNLYFTIGISPLDCTGCSLCTSVCPTGAIEMKSVSEVKDKEIIKFNYLETVTEKRVMNVKTVKGSQFIKPKFEFCGACAGCGETPYLKLLSQLFGDNLMIANATGCSSIYGASLPSTPYSVPWINSLFEDNAEFGFGLRVGEDFMREKVRKIMQENLDKTSDNNKELINSYLNNYSKETSSNVYENLDFEKLPELLPLKKYIKEKSIWLVGGDGWAYDIGFGGIDHVLANKLNVNILVLDTEVYSNTGGQASKSTRTGAIAKFAASGKETAKKDLMAIAMTYPHVYVGTVSLGANYMQTINTFMEAEAYDGPSIILAYSPCIAHGIKKGMGSMLKQQKFVAESGYFPIFKYNPSNKEFKIQNSSNFDKYEEIFEKENRYASSKSKDKEKQFKQNKEDSIEKYEKLKDKLIN